MAGDGVFMINDEITVVDSNNRPLYPAYHLLDRSVLPKTNLPSSFEVIPIERATLKRVAIGSDAWSDQKELLFQIWETKGLTGLQRLINMWNQSFGDDVSVAAVVVEDNDGRSD
jgi:hypothetical protein